RLGLTGPVAGGSAGSGTPAGRAPPGTLKAAVTAWLRSMVSVQVGLVPRDAQSLPQPRKSRPWSTAVNVTDTPGLNVHTQCVSHSPCELCTPAPPPGSNWLESTVMVFFESNCTDAVRSRDMVRLQVVPAPPQSPPQPTTTKVLF